MSALLTRVLGRLVVPAFASCIVVSRVCTCMRSTIAFHRLLAVVNGSRLRGVAACSHRWVAAARRCICRESYESMSVG